MTENKRFGYDCPFKDDKDFCHLLERPEICRPSVCVHGGEMNEDDEDDW